MNIDNDRHTPIGRVVATERTPTTTGQVRFWLASDVDLRPFDFVRISAPENYTRDIGHFYAIIDEIQQVSDEPSALSSFISADFGDSGIPAQVARVVTTYADATVLFNTEDNEMPVPHGARVHWPDVTGVRKALGTDDYHHRIPAGYITMSGPNHAPMTIQVDMDADYLIGPEGAHLNISGISGLATKTSYAMFLLTAIQQMQWKSNTEGSRAAFVILNVKGSDLLRLHEMAPDLDAKTKEDWERCGLSAAPLDNVTYFYPYSVGGAHVQTNLDSNLVSANVDDGRAYRYFYDVEHALERLTLMVEDIDDPNQTFISCAEYCMDNIDSNSTWNGFRDKIQEWSANTPHKSIAVASWRRFTRLFNQRTRNSMFTEKGIRARANRQVTLDTLLKHIQPGHVVVVDIAQLPDYLQSFVVGDVIDLVRRARIGDSIDDYDNQNDGLNTANSVILFADELNKFAPRYGQARSITRHLREISERGRSEGIILFGAEQFRTGVDNHVTGNSGTQVFGRTTAVEASRDQEIKGLPGSQTKRVAFLRKGELLVNHTRFSSGTLKLRFPRNAYRPG